MKNFYGKLIVLVTTFLVVTSAQAQCTNVTLTMNDSWGDGWNGGSISFTSQCDGTVYGPYSIAGSTGTQVICFPDGDYDYNMVPGTYPGEITWSLDNGVSGTGNSGSVTNAFTVGGGCPPPTTDVTLTMNDSWGDGWNGGSISFTSQCDGTVYGPYSITGSTGTQVITFPDGDYDITMVPGSYPGEITWSLDNGVSGTGNSGTITNAFTIGAGCPGGGGGSSGCDQTITLYDSFGDGWNGGSVTVLVNGTPVLSGITIATGGGPEVYTFPANDGDAISVTYSAGSWAGENYYSITDGNGTTLVSNYYPNTSGTWNGTAGCPVPCDQTITLYDTFGDGWNGGTVTVSVNGTAVLSGITIATGGGPEVYTFPANDGDAISVTYSAGSWAGENYYNITDGNGTTLVSNYYPNTSGTWNGTAGCGGAPACTDNEVTIDVTAGTFPSEVSWEFIDATGAVVASGGASASQTICIPDGCYDFVMNDSFGDGWNGATYTVTYNGGTIGSGTLADGTTGTDTGIGVNSVCDVYGCTDPASVNYNPAATIDDGSCAYPPANDDCANAISFTLTCGSSYTDAGSTANANNVGNGPTCTTAASTAGGVWYQFVGTGNDVTASLCGSSYDTKVFVYSGTCGSFTCEGGNDDACGLQSEVTIPTVQGTTYTILVAGFGSSTGDYTMTVTDNGTNSVAPTSITGTSNICLGSSTTLTLNGGTAGSGATANWYTGSCGGTAVGSGNTLTITPNSTTDYFVRYEGNCNTTSCATVTVSVDQPSTAATGITGAGSACLGTTSTLSVQGGSLSGSSNWEWYEGSCGGTVVGTGNSITVTPGSTTTYFVAATANGACAATTCASGTVTLPTPSAALSGNNETATCAVNQNGYIHLLTPAGDLVASINANGQNLGNVTATSYIEGTPLLLENCNNPGNASMMTSVMDRHWVITTQNAPTGPVSVLLPFTDNEVASLNIEAFNNANPDDDINFLGDVGCTKFSGANEDNLFDNNCGNGTFEWHTQTSNGQVDAYLASHPASNKYLTIDVNGFSEFWLHGSSTNAPLPVELTRFEANCNDNGAEVSWSTASEYNASHFKVKRSLDGVDWTTIAYVDAAGNSQQMIDYTIEDNQSTDRTVYYLLEQYDLDGTKQDERFTSLDCESSNDDLTMLVYPNPGNGEMTINFVAPEAYGAAYVTFESLNGMVVENVPVTIKSGQNNIILDCSSYAPGIYMINISNDQFKTKTTKYSKH